MGQTRGEWGFVPGLIHRMQVNESNVTARFSRFFMPGKPICR